MSQENVTNSAKGHAWRNKSRFPLTSAMTGDKPITSHSETGNVSAPKEGTAHRESARGMSEDGTINDEENGSNSGRPLKPQHSHKVDLISNTNARLANPLGDLTDEECMTNAAAFAEANGLPVEVFRKGGMLAKRPTKFEQLSTLTEEDRQILRDELSHPYRQPKVLYHLVIACSVAAAVQGMDESVISGAQLFYPEQFGINATISGRQRDSWLEGLVNGAPYLCAGVFGCWLTDPLNRWLGRRWTIFVTAAFSFLTCIWGALTNTWWHLFISRFFLGIGIGPKSATVPVFAAECLPAKIRGSMVMQWQIWTAFGIMLGYVADLAFYSVPDKPGITGLNWRLMLGSAGFPALIVMAQMPFLPESPRWLMSKGRYSEAYHSMLRLRGHEITAARDLYYIFVLLEEEASIIRGRNRFIEIFTIPRNRRAMLGSTIVMFGQQFCGVNAIVYYTATIFTSAGFSNINALLASWGFGMLNFLGAIPGLLTIDKFGRRPLLLFSFPFMSLSLLFTGLCFLIPESDKNVRVGLIALGIYVYCLFYSPGEGPVPFTYSAEVYPLYIRELGMSLATATLWTFNFIVSLTFPALLRAFTPTGAFGWYAGWCAVLWVLVLFFLPETKGYTLEELDQVFSVPTAVHASHQFKLSGWWVKKYLLRKQTTKPQLYHLDDLDISDEKREADRLARAGGGG